MVGDTVCPGTVRLQPLLSSARTRRLLRFPRTPGLRRITVEARAKPKAGLSGGEVECVAECRPAIPVRQATWSRPLEIEACDRRIARAQSGRCVYSSEFPIGPLRRSVSGPIGWRGLASATSDDVQGSAAEQQDEEPAAGCGDADGEQVREAGADAQLAARTHEAPVSTARLLLGPHLAWEQLTPTRNIQTAVAAMRGNTAPLRQALGAIMSPAAGGGRDLRAASFPAPAAYATRGQATPTQRRSAPPRARQPGSRALAVEPGDLPNALDGRAVAERAVGASLVVVAHPVWQRGPTGLA